jgi:hypothetical protein
MSTLKQTSAENTEINRLGFTDDIKPSAKTLAIEKKRVNKMEKWRFPSGTSSIASTKMLSTLIVAQPPTPR